LHQESWINGFFKTGAHFSWSWSFLCQKRKVCSASIAYIAGFYSFSLHKTVKCAKCLFSLIHSTEDPCPERSLILMKNYFNDHKGLNYPSGSLCSLLFKAQAIVRRIDEKTMKSKQAIDSLLNNALLSLDQKIFQRLQLEHSANTADGTETHYSGLIHLVLKKYFALRLKKICKDEACRAKTSRGNFIHRTRIFQNVW